MLNKYFIGELSLVRVECNTNRPIVSTGQEIGQGIVYVGLFSISGNHGNLTKKQESEV